MKSRIEMQSEHLKEQVMQELDEYIAELKEGLSSQTIKIDDVERMLVEKKAAIDERIREATGEMLSEPNTVTEKNNVPNVTSFYENKNNLPE